MAWCCSSRVTVSSWVSAPDCGPLIERFLDKPAPEALSQAALEVLSIVAYEQPITRAEISHIRGTDSGSVIETLLAQRLIEDDHASAVVAGPSSWRPPPTFCARSA
jgi:segregation and condensation protein B